MDQRLEHAHQANSEAANAREENLAIREEPMVSEGDLYPKNNDEVVLVVAVQSNEE